MSDNSKCAENNFWQNLLVWPQPISSVVRLTQFFLFSELTFEICRQSGIFKPTVLCYCFWEPLLMHTHWQDFFSDYFPDFNQVLPQFLHILYGFTYGHYSCPVFEVGEK